MEGHSRILFITRKWAPAVGGMETYCHQLTAELAAIEPIEVIALPGQANGMPPKMPHLLRFGLTASLRAFFRRRLPDVLHIGDMVLWPLALVGRMRGYRRIVISAHGTDVAFHRRGGLKGNAYGAYLRLGALLLGKATIIANSNATRDVTAGTGWRNIEVVPLATELRGPAPDGTHEDFILFAGRLVERKGCAWFIRNVLPLLPAGSTLKVAGTGWDSDELAALDHPAVEYVGNLQGTALIDAYRKAKCVIVPNIEPKSGEFEGFGLVATEGAAAGGLVLASTTGGLIQAIEEGVTGFGVPPGDSAAWAAAIGRISEWTDEQRKAFLARSMVHCQTYYSWDRVARETHLAYKIDK
ncbi:glycosyltransferase family 4 protein [Altererythrobacter fulvus]|uniref:glycosyltransferase family 4 protein n=1 Tax=Caenibius fulvus TaxID=2126012 RepID=UPI00301A1FD6